MVCPQCGAERRERLECPDCHVLLVDSSADVDERAGEVTDLDVLIRTGFRDPVAIGLVRTLLQEAEIPFFAMDQNIAARQESGNVIGWWSVRVSREKEAEAREILQAVERLG
jgi:hypothetical protein